MRTNSVRTGSFSRHLLPTVSIIALAGAVTMSLAKTAEGNPPSDIAELKALHDIEDLEYCYAAGTDAIGGGDLAKGKQIYATCFTPNAPIIITAIGDPPNTPPAVVEPNPNAWATLIAGLFSDAGYVSTQHQISNVRVEILPGGTKAKISSYLTATHVYDPESSVQLSHGRYESEATLTNVGWRISKRTYHTKTFLRLDSPPNP